MRYGQSQVAAKPEQNQLTLLAIELLERKLAGAIRQLHLSRDDADRLLQQCRIQLWIKARNGTKPFNAADVRAELDNYPVFNLIREARKYLMREKTSAVQKSLAKREIAWQAKVCEAGLEPAGQQERDRLAAAPPRLGLVDDAEATFETYSKDRPRSSAAADAAAKLLARIKGRLDERDCVVVAADLARGEAPAGAESTGGAVEAVAEVFGVDPKATEEYLKTATAKNGTATAAHRQRMHRIRVKWKGLLIVLATVLVSSSRLKAANGTQLVVRTLDHSQLRYQLDGPPKLRDHSQLRMPMELTEPSRPGFRLLENKAYDHSQLRMLPIDTMLIFGNDMPKVDADLKTPITR